MPAWMFDTAVCSRMQLLKTPYCSLDSLKQLLLLLNEASPTECIIGKNQNTFKQGDANAKLPSKTQIGGYASIPPTGSLSNDKAKSTTKTDVTSDTTDEPNDNRI
ncbi:MAG: hypothetical protein ABFD79_14300 [Phycisphaerales bacterium]